MQDVTTERVSKIYLPSRISEESSFECMSLGPVDDGKELFESSFTNASLVIESSFNVNDAVKQNKKND